MNGNAIVAAVLLPFIAWYAWSAYRAVRTGVFRSWRPIRRAEDPRGFWFEVVRHLLVGSIFVTTLVTSLLQVADRALLWIGIVYVAALAATGIIPVILAHRAPRASEDDSGSA